LGQIGCCSLASRRKSSFCKAGLDRIHRTIHKVHPKISGVGPSKAQHPTNIRGNELVRMAPQAMEKLLMKQ